MRKKQPEELPIRTFDNSVDEKILSNFSIDKVTPEREGENVIVEAHRHDYYHIMFIKDGYGEHSIDFKTYPVKPNSIFFVSPGQVHSVTIDENADVYVISFNSEFIILNNSVQKLLDYPFFHSMNNAPVIHLEENYSKIRVILEDMFEEYHSPNKGKDNILRALLEVLLVRASRMYPQPNEDAPLHLTFQLRKLEALIDAHYKEYKMLNDYAEMMHISPKHLNSLCKKGLNKTVTNLIHERILLEAKRILLFTDNSISEIAFELGFADKSYFMRFFKKHTSLTADSYRNQHTS